jgi:2-octaprenylphenol hydroxylase
LNISGHINVDVIIVGAGVVGASFAAILKNSGMTCALIEAESAKEKPDMGGLASFDPRTLALTQASKNILKSVGAWDEISEDRLGCFRKMHVWDENGLGEVNFNGDDLCEPIMGYIVEQKIVEAALESVLNTSDHVSWFRPASAKLLDTEKDKICIGLDDGRQLSAKLLVAADGQSSTVRRLAGINFKTHDYHQDALACVVETERPHQQVARQRFLSRGPLAFLPMAHPNQCGIVWSTTAEQAAELKALDEKAFSKTLAEAFAYQAGEIMKVGPRATFPLARAQAEEYCRPRLALVGDAAHRIHPLAGQGANLGLLDVACLAEVVLQAREKGRDFGAIAALRKYERWRKGDNSTMMMTMEGFKYLFENKTAAVSWLRNIGMDVFDSMPPIKQCVMKRAMGLAGDLPAIARKIY